MTVARAGAGPGTAAADAVPSPRAESRTFGDVYDAYFDDLWRNARAFGVPAHSVDDVLQDVFLVVHRRLGEFEGRSSVRTWLMRILYNVVKEHRRRFRRKELREVVLAQLPDVGGSCPMEETSKAEAARRVCTILDSMDDDKRVVFVLAEVEQLPIAEIAAIVRAGENTVSSRLRLARREFQKHVQRLRAKDDWRLA